MREEYNNIFSTPTQTNNIGHFGPYGYIGQTDISVYLYL